MIWPAISRATQAAKRWRMRAVANARSVEGTRPGEISCGDFYHAVGRCVDGPIRFQDKRGEFKAYTVARDYFISDLHCDLACLFRDGVAMYSHPFKNDVLYRLKVCPNRLCLNGIQHAASADDVPEYCA